MTGRRRTIAIGAALTGLACASVPAAAQNLGTYEGVIEIEGVQHGPEVHYKARIRVLMPVSSRDKRSIDAEFLAGEAPQGKIDILEWEESDKDKSPDSEGVRNSYRCSLADAVTLPATVQGVLNVDTANMEHTWSISVVSMDDADFKCVHSRSGPYKTRKGFSFSTGTGVPGSQSENPLPIGSASHIMGQYVLDPTDYTDGKFGPINQKWEFTLK